VTLASDAVMKWLVYLSKIKTLRSAHIMHFSSCFSLMCITVLEGQPFHVNSLEAMSYISLTSVTCDQLRILSQTKIDCEIRIPVKILLICVFQKSPYKLMETYISLCSGFISLH